MRITIVIAGLGGGGAERVCVNLANAWVDRGYHPTVLTISQNSRPPAYTIDARVELHDIGWPRWARSYELNAATIAPIMRGLQAARCPELIHDIKMLALLRYAILTTQPDIVVSMIDQTNVRVLAAMHEAKAPVIVCEVTDARRVSLRGWQHAREALYHRAATVVALDQAIADWFSARGYRARAIPSPLVKPSAPIRTNTNSRKRVITLSRLSAEKRPEWLLRAFATIAEKHPDWDLVFYGVGPQKNTLEHLAEKLASPGRIKFCGFTHDAYAALSNADIFVSASRIEGFGNAIWEALASGVPVIAMDAGPSIYKLVRHGIDGLIVKENSVAALAQALDRLMSDEAERKNFASRAPEVIDRFSLEAALASWDELLTLSRTR
jgi:GalNAc-alpha-(1->4)-GalNAc-alpha-(1->3)-diNAcBac-PP-undecaprenol alpha-1,4-N-acetyl-D-galactosaminyltransferase